MRFRYTIRTGEEEVVAYCRDQFELRQAREQLRQTFVNGKGIFAENDRCRTHQCLGYLIRRMGISKKNRPYDLLVCSDDCGFVVNLLGRR